MPLRTSRAALLATLAIVLAGCTSGLAGNVESAAPAPKLEDVAVLDDPGAWSGPSTAVMSSSAIEPVRDGEQTLPAAVVDSQGTPVTVTDASRILTLDIYGSLSRIVFELGLGDQVVARDISSGFAEIADRPLVTQNGHDLNAEAILEAAPSVIITDTSLGPWDVILQLRETGIPVVVVDSKRSIEGVDALVQEVAVALGVPERGEILAERTRASIEAKVADIASVAPRSDEARLRMIFLYVRGQSGIYYLFGEGSGTGSLIEALGGVDVASEIGWQGMRPITDEALISANPDLILMMTKGIESVNGVDGLLEQIPAIGLTTAGKQRRIVDMDDTQILSFGPATAELLDALAVAIYAPAAVATSASP